MEKNCNLEGKNKVCMFKVPSNTVSAFICSYSGYCDHHAPRDSRGLIYESKVKELEMGEVKGICCEDKP